MAFKILGDDVILSMCGADSTYGLLQAQCSRGLSFTFQTETAEITSVDVDEVSVIPTYKSMSIEVNMLLVYGDSNVGYNNIFEWADTKEKIFFEIEIPYTDSSCIISGRGYITNIPVAANFNEAASMNFTIAVSGERQIIFGSEGSTLLSYFGWRDVDTLPSEAEILSLQNSGEFSIGATIYADFTANSEPKYLVMAERVTNPIKTSWYGSEINNGIIGVDELFYVAGTVVSGSGANWRVYITSYETQQETTNIQFRV